MAGAKITKGKSISSAEMQKMFGASLTAAQQQFLQGTLGGGAVVAAAKTPAKTPAKAPAKVVVSKAKPTGTASQANSVATVIKDATAIGNTTKKRGSNTNKPNLGIDREFSGKEARKSGGISEIRALGAADRRFKFGDIAARKNTKRRSSRRRTMSSLIS
jgi:hypothetical protein